MNFFDRQVPGAVAEPMRKALSLSDKDLGWMTPAFLLLYAVLGVPLGRWADLGRRTRILAVGVTLWSIMTAVSGLAWNFWSLFFMRLGVGIGEASCAPTANSLLGDLFPRERRARAISVFMLGLPLGLGLSSMVSGKVADLWDWRHAFYVAAIPGLILGMLCLGIPEPTRGAAEAHPVGTGRRQGSAILVVLGIPTMWWIILSGALHNFNMYALGQFLSPFLQRYHGLTTGGAGFVSGLVYCVGGLGIYLGGWACDWIVGRRISGRLEVSMLALAVATPCIFFALLQDWRSPWTFTVWMLPGGLLLYVYYSGVYATIQDIVEPALRGTAMAVYFFVMYLLAAFGPVILGDLSDRLRSRALAGGLAEGEMAATIPPLAASSVGLMGSPLAPGPLLAAPTLISGRSEAARAVGLHQAMYLIPALSLLLVGVLFAASRTVSRDYRRLHEAMAELTADKDQPSSRLAPAPSGGRET
jgi:MFS family permease